MTDETSTSVGAFWDSRYADDDYFYGTAPNHWLTTQANRLQPGMSALAVGDGEGRNGVWLAEKGLAVTSVDASPRAQAKARALAARRGVAIDTVCTDLRHWDWPQAAFDCVVSIFLHLPPDCRAGMHRRMLAALKPGGLLLLQAYTPRQLDHGTGGPRAVELLYSAAMLREDLAEAEIISLKEVVCHLHEGTGHNGASAVVELVARRPL